MKPPTAGPPLCLLASLAAVCLPHGLVVAADTNPHTPPAAHRILFLGDSITYSGQFVEYFEAVVRIQFPEWRGEVLNLGLPSETVSGLSEAGHAGGQFPRPDLHERLERVLGRTRPDLVIACYGMNDGIYQPFDEDRFHAFQDGIRRLRRQADRAGARIIHLTPPTYDRVAAHSGSPPAFDYNEVLDRYSDWLLDQRRDGWVVLDVHTPMNLHLAARRKRDPGYQLASDGVHVGETGHWLIARPLLVHFDAPAELATAESPRPWLDRQPAGSEVLGLVQQGQRILKDAWLTDTGHKRPGMNQGLPLAEAQARAAEINGRIGNLVRRP